MTENCLMQLCSCIIRWLPIVNYVYNPLRKEMFRILFICPMHLCFRWVVKKTLFNHFEKKNIMFTLRLVNNYYIPVQTSTSLSFSSYVIKNGEFRWPTTLTQKYQNDSNKKLAFISKSGHEKVSIGNFKSSTPNLPLHIYCQIYFSLIVTIFTFYFGDNNFYIFISNSVPYS